MKSFTSRVLGHIYIYFLISGQLAMTNAATVNPRVKAIEFAWLRLEFAPSPLVIRAGDS